MKFRIRYADQLVGLLVIIALLSLIVVIFLLGRTQRWFSVNYSFKTYATTASGLSRNMDVVFKGVTIGKVKSFDLMDDNRIEIIFTIQDDYRSRVKRGSLVEVIDSPIGLAAKFIFYSGLGEELQEGDLVPMIDSPEGKALAGWGLTDVPAKDDFIADLVEKVGAVVSELQKTLEGINVATNEKAVTALGQTIANIQQLTAGINSPTGIGKVLSGEGESINALEGTLVSLRGTMGSVEKTASLLPRDVAVLLNNVQTTLQSAEKILISLQNNPILRGGIPQSAEIDSSGTNPRSIKF